MKTLFSLVATALLAAPCVAAEIHVSPSGDDTAPGTADRPLKTLETAQRAARQADQASDRLAWRRLPSRQNAPLRPRRFRSNLESLPRRKTPVLSGGIAATGWTADVKGRFKAAVDLDNFRQLWVNGQRAPRARGRVPAGLKFWGKNEATVPQEGGKSPSA